MERETPINGRPRGRISEAAEDAGLALRDRVVWPLEDRAYLLGVSGRTLGAIAAVVLVLGASAVVVASSGSGGSEKTAAEVAATTAPVSQPAAAAPKVAPRATLHGVPPVFKPAKRSAASRVGASKPIESAPAPAKSSQAQTGSPVTDAISSTPSANAAKAADSSVKGPPAGPEAISVAREFAKAFVVYEVGGTDNSFRKAFRETTTPQLRRALLRRPPRQPAGVAVPKAKLLNIVPAPSHGSVYPVSVSLLRVGVTSELRLEMERLKNKRWRVTNVLG
jgi:hypothetical protein